MRSIFTGEFGFARPTGLTYVGKTNVLLVAKAAAKRTRLLRLGRFEERLGTLSLPKLSSPSTLSFDAGAARVAAITGKTLLTVRAADLTKARPPVTRTDISRFGLRRPQAATFDPASTTMYILDGRAREILRLDSRIVRRAKPVRLSLRHLGARTLRGLAYNPTDRLLYVTSIDRDLLYGLDRSGKVRKTYSIKNAALRNITTLVFAPSTDPTDAPTVRHLYVADRGGPTALGRVVELSLAPPVSLPVTVTGRLVRTIETGRLAPAVPDPSGVTYLAASDTLMITDSEVEEMPIYRGANLFRITRAGTLVETGTTLSFSREPTGVGYDPATDALFISDDDKRRVLIVRPGPDRRHGTADDAVKAMSTAAFGSVDPEGVEFDPHSGRLFVADGVGAEIYAVDPVDGVFANGDDAVSHFDVSRYGVRNCEGIGYDARRKTLLVVDDHQRKIFELTTEGALVRILNLATIPSGRWLASVTVAPTSNPNDSPTAMSYWVADRGVDNNADPNENDGKIYEVSLP